VAEIITVTGRDLKFCMHLMNSDHKPRQSDLWFRKSVVYVQLSFTAHGLLINKKYRQDGRISCWTMGRQLLILLTWHLLIADAKLMLVVLYIVVILTHQLRCSAAVAHVFTVWWHSRSQLFSSWLVYVLDKYGGSFLPCEKKLSRNYEIMSKCQNFEIIISKFRLIIS